MLDLPPGTDGVPVAHTASDLAMRTRQAHYPKPIARDSSAVASRMVTIIASYQGQNPALTYEFCVFPAVTPMKVWEVLRIGVSGNDPFTTLAGVNCLAFRSAVEPQDSNSEPATFGDLIAVLGQVPNTSYPPARSVFVRGMERVNLCLKGLANGQLIQASMDVVEHDLATYLQSLASK